MKKKKAPLNDIAEALHGYRIDDNRPEPYVGLRELIKDELVPNDIAEAHIRAWEKYIIKKLPGIIKAYEKAYPDFPPPIAASGYLENRMDTYKGDPKVTPDMAMETVANLLAIGNPKSIEGFYFPKAAGDPLLGFSIVFAKQKPQKTIRTLNEKADHFKVPLPGKPTSEQVESEKLDEAIMELTSAANKVYELTQKKIEGP